RAQALVTAAARASDSVFPSTARQAWRPPKSMHTSQRTPPTRRLEETTKPISASSTPAGTHDVHFMRAPYATWFGRSTRCPDSGSRLDYEGGGRARSHFHRLGVRRAVPERGRRLLGPAALRARTQGTRPRGLLAGAAGDTR